MRRNSLLCRYCKETETFQNERGQTRWGVRCDAGGRSALPIRNFDTQQQAQASIDDWCFGDGRFACRLFLRESTGQFDNTLGNDQLLKLFEAWEEQNVPKQTYYCKCGKTFQKHSTAQDTGWRLEDYDAAHECYGCPFVEQVIEWDNGKNTVKAHECRASAEQVNYTTKADWSKTGDCTSRVYTLDVDWLEKFIAAYRQAQKQPDEAEDAPPVPEQPADRQEHHYRLRHLCQGRRVYSFNFEPNKAGRTAKEELFEAFFDTANIALASFGAHGDRKKILDMIEREKAAARAGACEAAPPASPAPPEPAAADIVPAVPAQEENKGSAAPIGIARGITEITAEICFYKAQTVQNIIEIGKRLVEAKEMLAHGEWGDWLKNSVEFSHRTATNLMNVATQFSNSQPVANLPYTKLIALLSVPEDAREDFLEQPHEVDGKLKTVDEMSKREMERVIRERDEEKRRADQAQQRADEAHRKADEATLLAQRKTDRMAGELRVAQQKLDDMQDAAQTAARREVAAQFAEVNRVAEESVRKVQALSEQLAAAQAAARGTLSEDAVYDAVDSFQTMISSALEGLRVVLQAAEPQTRVDALEGAVIDIKAVAARMQEALAVARELTGNETEEET